MAFSTFSGPVRSGTTRYTTGVTADTIDNTGLMVLSQFVSIDFADATFTAAVLPAGSQILNIFVDTSTLFDAATTVEFGTSSNADEFATSTTVTTAGRHDASANLTSSAINVGSSDIIVQGTVTTTATDGAATVTVVYVQKASNGATAPTAFEN